ncbi:MAG: STM4015 family protein [Tannerellaceae bacterium]|nr:STM4015 family protein [Tannerellaceae bacterium]
MKRVFVFQDFKSQKFWSIDVEGSGFTVNYGKLGTEGQTQEKTFASPEEAEKQAAKLIAEKTKKGYVETEEEAAKEMKAEARKYKLSYEDYDAGRSQKDLLNKIISDKKLPEIKQLTIGCWSFESEDCQELVDGMVANKEKFEQVEGLFWGDIDQEESEISWIDQANLSPLLDAMPRLRDLRIKGTHSLSIGQKPRPNLRSLEIISGGLHPGILDDVLKSDFPNLETLILYVGIDDYGFEGPLEVFKPLFSKEKFPKLTYLGLVNAQEQDQIVTFFLESDILPQLETMDIAAGVLTDKGGQLLLDNVDKIKHLKCIDMKYNYLSEEMQKKLSQLPVKTDVSDAQAIDDEYDEYGGYPLITE